MVNKNQIEAGLAAYVDSEFLPQLHMQPLQQTLIGAGACILTKRIGTAIDNLKNNAAMNALGIIDVSGNVDIDILAQEIKAKMPQEGLRIPVPLLGEVVMHTKDIDTLYRMIIGGA